MSATSELRQDPQFRLPKRMQGLQPTLIRQFFERALPDSINFGLGEPDLPTPEFLRKEAARVTLDEQNGYTSHTGIPALRTKIAEQYLKKGSKVYLEGALQTRKWTDQQGVEKYSTEVVLQGFNSALTMLDRAGGGGGDFGGGGDTSDFGSSRPAARQPAMAGAGGKRGDLDDEIPF